MLPDASGGQIGVGAVVEFDDVSRSQQGQERDDG